MGNMNEFSLEVRLFLKLYRWRRIDPVPWTPLRKSLSKSRLALVSTAAFRLPDQPPFDFSIKGGDPSFRVIPCGVDCGVLYDTHPSTHFDHTGLHQDPNVAFPIDRVRELVAWGRLGAVNERHLSFMGAITAPGRLIHETAPEAARLLVEDEVDVALLVPV